MNDLWKCLWTPALVDSWSRTKNSVIEAREGGKFVVFEGAIEGNFCEFSFPTAKLTWRERGWAAGEHSTVTFSLSKENNGTLLSISQAGIPSDQAESNEKKWVNVYLHSLERQFRLFL